MTLIPFQIYPHLLIFFFKEFEGEEMYERLIKTIFDNIFNQPHQNLIPIP